MTKMTSQPFFFVREALEAELSLGEAKADRDAEAKLVERYILGNYRDRLMEYFLVLRCRRERQIT
jgi:hypothetical protein